jgi:hypothetical protein
MPTSPNQRLLKILQTFIHLKRAFPHSKAPSAGFWTTPQLTRLALSSTSIRRKRHESVMSIVMGSGPKL